jgi:putative oxidoreductase
MMMHKLGQSDTARNLGTLIGRALMSAIFIWSGYGKLIATGATKEYFESLGVPLPGLALIVSVIIELGGGLLLLTGIQGRLVALILAVWCIITAITGHSNFADPGMQIQFMKNLAMSSGFLYIALFGVGAYSVKRG